MEPRRATVEILPECLREDLASIREEKVRDGIIHKIALLERDPLFGKPLGGPLSGHHRLTYGRYRIVYRWNQPRDHVLVWYVGLRREDLYRAIEHVARRRGVRGPQVP
ncbi:MAG: type II toxin-antitoxin system RelE family toxin [Armatimonadota bacterium]